MFLRQLTMLLGQLGLILAVIGALVAVSSPMGATRWPLALELARRAQLLSAIGSTAALTVLTAAFATQRWGLEYVSDHARSGVGPLLRLSGVWAGAEGSLLLWTTMVGWAAVLANRIKDQVADSAAIRTVQLGALTTGAYAAINLLVASPFDRLALTPVDGLGLQPILEHPAMVWHPPILYAGLVGLLPALFLTIGGNTIPRWLLQVPLAVLAVGLLTGSRWAHAELGWGGYWAWDPIETAGLIAWLCGAAALHSAEPGISNHLPRMSMIAPGLAAIWATTLTRIGVIESVHAFADRPALRSGLLLSATLISAMSLGLWLLARRAGNVSPTSAPIHDHRTLAAIVLASAAFLAAVGTYQPLVEAATSGDRVAIAGTYFSRMLGPLTIVGVALAVRADRRWWPALAGATAFLILTPASAGPAGLCVGFFGGSLIGTSLGLLGRRRPGAIAHLGVGLMLVGIAGTVATQSASAWIANGETVEIAGIELTHHRLNHRESTQRSAVNADATLGATAIHPGLIRHQLRGATTSEVANQILWLDEVQVVLLDGDNTGARYRVNRLPRLVLVWVGGAVLATALVAAPLRRWQRSKRSAPLALAGQELVDR